MRRNPGPAAARSRGRGRAPRSEIDTRRRASRRIRLDGGGDGLAESAARDAEVAARSAGLRHVTDAQPGIVRRRVGAGFLYRHPSGALVREDELLRRIRALAIPPAWTHVWICPDARGHIQATGRDARGRKQYRYHEKWRAVRDETKYGRLRAFGAALPRIRRRTARDMEHPGLPREKVLAALVRLLDRTLIRIGNAEYARTNSSFGLTTLRERHVHVTGQHLQFHFRGKSGKEHVVELDDPRLASIVKRCQDLPGQELFHFRDDAGTLHPIESADVNAYLREAAGADFTAKDFRTWHGTLLAASLLSDASVQGRPTKKALVRAIEQVAARLGNTPNVCRKSYVHPEIVTRYLDGALVGLMDREACHAAQELALLGLLGER